MLLWGRGCYAKGGNRETAWAEGASCSPTALTVCFSLAALAEGAVVGRRGATAKGTFAAQPFEALPLSKAPVLIQRILTEQQQPLRENFASELSH